VGALRRCEAVNGGEPITVFEITTAAALLLFAEEPADVLLLEVGLGGRLDATNVIDRPAAAVVTPIGHDHAEYLGTTLEAIAREKAGIFKRGCPAVIAPQDYLAADRTLREEAERLGASPLFVGQQDFTVHEEGGRLVYQDERGLLDLPRPRLAGGHQFVNAGTAIAALRAAGFEAFETSAFEAGLTRAQWPGRLQRLARGRLPEIAPEGCEIWLDGGHNPDGGRVLAAAMADRGDRNDAPLVLVTGCWEPRTRKPSSGISRASPGGDRRSHLGPDRGPPCGRGGRHRGGRGADRLHRAQRRIGARLAPRLRVGPPAPGAHLRLALPGGRGAGGQRNAAGVEGSQTVSRIERKRPDTVIPAQAGIHHR
jgi:folylpolyglutamate synthase/dihydropteroate synthase